MDKEVKTPTLMKETEWYACGGGGLEEGGVVHDVMLRDGCLKRCRRIRKRKWCFLKPSRRFEYILLVSTACSSLQSPSWLTLCFSSSMYASRNKSKSRKENLSSS